MLLELAQRHGIEAGYHDIWGTWHALSTDTAQALLGAVGVDASSEAELVQGLADCEERPWLEFAPSVVVNRDEQPCEVMLTINACHDQCLVRWWIECEDGARVSGEQQCAQLEVRDQRARHGTTLRRCRLALPDELSHGYHRLHIEVADHKAVVALIRTPARCANVVDERVWGLCVQLYGLRSTSNWGIGDFGDLRLAIQIFAARGADFVGLNPLHALYLDTPSHISPYSPSSREHTNALYLHIESMADYADCESARAMVEAVEFQATLASLRQCELVDYVGVAACKRRVFECLFEYFAQAHFDIDTGTARSARGHEFAMFCDVRGEDLRRYAVFETLHEHFGHSHDDGQAWHVEYRAARGAADSPEIAQFVASHGRRIAYFQYLQWQCETQLTSCREHASNAGMRIGLYLDLAVGSDGHGADVCSEPENYAARVSIGAPTDDFALQGQVWGLPPLRTDRLRDAAYDPFIRCLRANMCHAGALRIDHVLGLLRLFWVPDGGGATDGAYVHYPVNDLLAITALESTRAQCVVVGEDLGTVPDAMREA
ncbi:MAG: (1-_4)-alpha-D-glucan 1-alpha-D-glucosylmutase, partial [Gammaproteobacteria bacterium]